MTVTIHSPFHGPPTISREGFITVLERTGSFDSEPLWGPFPRNARPDVAYQCYDIIADAGHDPAVHLAILGKESSFGTNQSSVLWRNNTRSYSNARTIRHPDVLGEIITDSYRRSNYVRYQDIRDSFRDGVFRVDEEGFAYRQANANTIAEVIAIWAPADDSNDPSGYSRTMVDWINQWAKEFPPANGDKPMSLKVALSAGHRNNDGGNATEQALVAEHCYASAQAFRAAGADVRVVTPNDGRGWFQGGLQAVAQRVVDWFNGGWKADIFIEFHTEGTASHIRGAFTIYPDWGNDVDTVVRDKLGPDMAKRVAGAMGIPVRGNGIMSEKNTGVGGQGFRLGVFLRSEPIRRHTTRLLLESGAHSNAQDLAVLRRPETPGRIAQAVVEAVYAYYDVKPDEPKGQEDPNARYFEETGYWIVNANKNDDRITMLDHWRDSRGINGAGYPIGGMTKDDDGVYRQLCENVLLEAWPPGTWGGNSEVIYRFGGLGRRYRDAQINCAVLQAEIDGNPECDCT